MRIVKLKDETKLNNSIVVLGNFDGLHRGHMSLLEKAKELKEEQGGSIVFFTFYPHPLEVITGLMSSDLVFSRDEKIFMAESLGADIYFECGFDKETAATPPSDFVSDILVYKLGAKAIVVGEDFRFAYKRMGNVELLEALKDKYNYSLYPLKKLEIDGEIVSSTLLRQCLRDLDFAKFRKLTGRDYFILGEVLHGKAIGRTLGYPTANQRIDDRKLALEKGVYASRTHIGDRTYDSISFVGNSLGNKARGQFETFIFDFSDDIYGEIIRVDLLDFIRESKKVDSLDHLKEMIDNDIKEVKSRTYK